MDRENIDNGKKYIHSGKNISGRKTEIVQKKQLKKLRKKKLVEKIYSGKNNAKKYRH